MKTKLFVTDLDGTLFNKDRDISFKDLQALARLQENDVITAIATGRSIYSFKMAVKQLQDCRESFSLPIDYIIFSTGAGIMTYPEWKVIFSRSLTTSDIQRIVSYFDVLELDYMVHKDIPDTHYFFFKSHNRENSDFQARMDLYQPFARPCPDEIHQMTAATEILAILNRDSSHDWRHALIKEIVQQLSIYSVIHATSPLDHQSPWIEVFHRNVSKAQTTAWLADHLHISRENIVAVGNDYNDLDLLSWCGNGYVVNNAPETIKHGFSVVASHNHSGVSQAAELSGWLL